MRCIERICLKGYFMKYCFIINPASGKPETKADLENKIKEFGSSRGIDFTVLYTSKAGDATTLIKDFAESIPDERIRFYACGGDGTLCEAVNGVMSIEDRERVSLGVIPVGTGNDFVRCFSPRELFFDIGAQVDAEDLLVDLIKCNDTYAVNMVNIGFDCQVVVKTAVIKKKKFVPSRMAYICGLVATLAKKPGVTMDLAADGEEAKHREYLLTTFANGKFCGGGFYSNPQSEIQSGTINALFINDVSRRRFLGLVGSYKKGTHLTEKNKDILHSEISERYSISFDAPTEISVDGEIIKTSSLELSCVPQAIRFLVPKGSAYIGNIVEEIPQTANV